MRLVAFVFISSWMSQAQIADKRGVAFVENCFIVRTRAWLYMMLSVNEQQKLQRKHIQSVKTKRSALTQTLLSGYSYGSDWRALLLGSLSMLPKYKGAASASTSYRNARCSDDSHWKTGADQSARKAFCTCLAGSYLCAISEKAQVHMAISSSFPCICWSKV